MKGKDKQFIKPPLNFKEQWEEIRLCGSLINQGLAKIVIATSVDGEKRRYTKILWEGKGMQASKIITRGGGITIPRGMRQETGILPGVPVDVVTDETGIFISKHVPACFHCGTVEDVKEVLGIEICPACAVKILEGFE